MTINIRPLAK